jgi:hypothetical protein
MDDLNIRLAVQAEFSITLGVYAGPITKETIAAHVADQIQAAGGVEMFISNWILEEVSLDDGTSLASSGKS